MTTPTTERQSKATVIALPSWQALQIVQPLIEMSVTLMSLSGQTKREELMDSAKRYQEGLRELARVMTPALLRPVYVNHLRNVSVKTALVSGIFDIYLTEARPSEKGAVTQAHHVRLVSKAKLNTMEKFVEFIRANDPQGSEVHARAQEMINVMGL